MHRIFLRFFLRFKSNHEWYIIGVSSVETDVASKSVVVQADSSVTPEFLLDKLTKVSTLDKVNVIELPAVSGVYRAGNLEQFVVLI